MEHAAKTPAEALAKIKAWQEIEFKDKPDLYGGIYYVRDRENYHPLRRYAACYIKGKNQDKVLLCAEKIDGIIVIK